MTSGGRQGYTETEQYITTFQASALATQNPADTESLTASDILNLAAYVLQSGATIAALEEQGVGILAISQVRNPYFADDRVRYEASPSFDFQISHKQIVSTVSSCYHQRRNSSDSGLISICLKGNSCMCPIPSPITMSNHERDRRGRKRLYAQSRGPDHHG